LRCLPHKLILLYNWHYALASPSMGHWGTCPVDFSNIFFGSSRTWSRTKSMPVNSIWFPVFPIALETRCVLSRLECTKIIFVFGRDSATHPAVGAYDANLDPLVGYPFPTLHPIHAFGVSVRQLSCALSHQFLVTPLA